VAICDTKILSFKANYGQDPRIGFKVRKKRKYEGVEKFDKNKENSGRNKSGTRENTRRDKKVCKQKESGSQQI